MVNKLATPPLRPKLRPRTKTDEKTLRGRSVFIDETGDITGAKGTRYSEVTTTIPWGTEWITAPSVDEDGSKLSDEEVARRLKDNEGRDFITGEKLPTFESESEASAYAEWRSDTMFDQEQIEKGYKPVLEQQQYEEDVEETLSDKVMRKAKPFTDEVKGFADYLMTPSQHFDEGGLITQTEEVLSLDSEGRRRRADKERESTTVKDAATFVASATPIIGDAMAAKEVYDELQKDDPNYYLAGALGGAAIIGLVPGLGDAAASAIRAGARKTFDTVKRVEMDPNRVGMMGGNVRLKPKDDITQLNQDKVIDEVSEIESASNPKPVKVSKNKKTVKAYKLFKTNDKGELYPLFVKMEDNKPIPKGKWIKAEEGSLNTKTGKVKSSIGDLAYRPGFHAGDLPIATHIGGKVDLETGQRLKGSMPPNIREENQVWAEVEMLDEFDWQSVANERARIKKDGTPDVKTAHITDQVPYGGFYRYKTNPNMTGNWLIGGELKVKKVLSSKEVKKINDKAGVADLPKLSDLGLKFNQGGIAMKDDINMGYALGGEVDAIDPVSGNEIPPGSTAKEVRDDIPTMLSEGEYVVPADVLKFYGLKFFEDLRDNAKVEMAELEEEGRIGGQPVPEEGELTEDEMTLLGEVMSMAEGGMNQMQPQQPQPPQPMMMGQQMMPPKPQPTQFNKPVGFDEGGMTDAFGNPIGPAINPPEQPQKFLQDIDQESTNIYGINKETTGTSSPTNLAQEDIGVKTTDKITTGDGSGMKTVFYFHPDGRRIQVLMLNGRPISSVPADFSEFKEDTPENRTEVIQETPDPTDDISGGVGKTKSVGGSGPDDEDRKVEAKKLETLKTNKEKKRVEDFNNLLDPTSDLWKADTDGSKLLEEYRKAKIGQGLALGVPGVGLFASGAAKKTLNDIEEAYLKKAKQLGITPEEAQKTLDSITGAQAIKEGITKPFEDKTMGEAMSDLFGDGFYDKYEAKYSVSDYLEDESIVGFQKDAAGNLSGNLDVKQQQHFDNAVDRGDSAIAEHFSRVAKSNSAKDQFAVDNADAIAEIQKLEKGTAEYDTAFKKLKSNNKIGNLYLGDSSIEEVIELGSSALTAKNLGKAEKEDKFFGKTVAKTDSSGKKNNSPITSTSSGSSSSVSSSSTKKDTIKSGDTLSAIAAKNNTTVNELMKANPNIKDANKIQAGASINIPQKSSGGGGGSSGGGGGGSSPSASSAASGCVIATHAVASGAFQSGDKANAVEWCKKTLHDKWWGETMRKGYRYLGRKHIANGTAETVYKEFKECIEWANGKRPFTIKVASRYYYRAIQTFLVGLFVKEEM